MGCSFVVVVVIIVVVVDVLENAFTPLSDENYEIAMKHVRELLDLNPDQETSKYDAKLDVMWAVVAAFNK
jgi:golgi phosphoprotein 3